MVNKVGLKKVSLFGISDLQEICNHTYSMYFGNHWEAEGLELYLEEQFSTQKLISDLNNESIDYFFIRFNEKLAGYLKINYETIIEDFDTKTVCELEKMYILPEYKGKGIGKTALTSSIETIQNKGKNILFLCVLDTNERAISFYKKLGFKFHSKIRLKYAYFKEELKGLDRMYLELQCKIR